MSTSNTPRFAVLGAGAWGTALAAHLASRNHDVLLWGRDESVVDAINNTHRNPDYLGDIDLPQRLKVTASMEACAGRDVWLWVTPAQTITALAPRVAQLAGPDASIVLCAKGIDRETRHLPHETAGEHFNENAIFALSGPSFARDVARGLPTAVVLAGVEENRTAGLAQTLSGPALRIYTSTDVTGVEAGGALKNIMAVAVGIARGLGLGASAEAALIARGFAELVRLATALGGEAKTLNGLSGLGDLVLTCSSAQSRNFAYGVALAEGENLEGRPLAEGVHTAAIALALARQKGIDTPIIEGVCAVLDGRLTAKGVVEALLNRPLRAEE